MSSALLLDAVRDLGWSLFTELGVPGVVRHHPHIALDPEPILVAAPAFFELDPRLRDQVYGWCAAHAHRVSVSRLQGLLEEVPEATRTSFHALAATLRAHAKVRWPLGDAPAWPRAPEVKPTRLPLERPALVRFRLRGLCGVGARADVLAELLAREGVWTRASDLASEGYSKRAVAGILSELAEAGLARQLADRNALTWRLARPDTLRTLVGGHALPHPPWRPILALTLRLLELARLQDRAEPVRRIEANNLREPLQALADRLDLTSPPATRGVPEAWEILMTWATWNAVALADGTSTALVGRDTPALLAAEPGFGA